MTKEEAKKLLEKYAHGQCTPSEKKLVDLWLEERSGQDDFFWESEEETNLTKNRIRTLLLDRVVFPRKRVTNKHVFFSIFCVLTIMVVSLIYYFDDDRFQHLKVTDYITNTQNFDARSATLTLGNGTVIDLNKSNNNFLGEINLPYIEKLEDDQLVFKSNDSKSISKIDTNTLSVPIGSSYKIILPDGSKVWLNAASRLKFPTQFIGNQRYVKLEGEAYFEIAKNVKQPFIVDAGEMKTRVTGTSFNISSYKEEVNKVVTLVEGEIYVSNSSTELKLLPGDKVIIGQSKGITKVKADIDAVTAWRNGYFVFDDQEIETVLRDVARWYDVEIFIQKKSNLKKEIGGAFSRKRDVLELLEYLEKLKVLTFKKEGRRLNVIL